MTSDKMDGVSVHQIRESLAEIRTDGRLGDLKWTLIQGDCREALPTLEKESVHSVITSPPYFWQRDYGTAGQIGLEASIDGYVGNLVTVFRGVWSALRNDGTVFLNLGDTYYSAKGLPHGDDSKHRARRFGLRAVDATGLGLPRKSLIGIPWRVALALSNDGWTLRSSIIWVRKSSMPEPTAKDRPWRKHENLFLFSKSPRYHFSRAGLQNEEDVWNIEPDRNSIARGIHYAPFPRSLVERCISTGCPERGVVLDPFVGGGTTMTVALSMKRSAVGIEISPAFCKVILDHLALSETTGDSLQDNGELGLQRHGIRSFYPSDSRD
ncbi:MAG: DNA-methyltransferase [Dehalococcoidia bacterium]